MSGIDPAAVLKILSDLQTRNAALEQKIAELTAEREKPQPKGA